MASEEGAISQLSNDVSAMEVTSTTPDVTSTMDSQTRGIGDGTDFVTPWEVSTTDAKGIDYDKLIGQCINIFYYLACIAFYI
jgi:hypothetical protein